MLLEVTNLDAGYSEVPVLRGISMHVAQGEVIAVLGSNGAGKSTLNRVLSGLMPPWGGSVHFEDADMTGCDAALIGLIDVVDAVLSRRSDSGESAPPWGHYVLIDYAARWTAGEPIAGDDARDARFFTPAELAGLNLWSETLRIITAARTMA